MRGADAGVPDAVPGPDELEREVGEVVDRPVDVSFEVEPEREGALVERLAVGDPVGADDPGDADVDHPRVDQVERDTGNRQHRDPERQPSHRRPGDQRPGALARPEPRDQHPDQEVAEHRVGERDRGGDLGAVEEEQRDPEPDQHQQVEVQQSQRPARVEERRTEQQAEWDPDPGRVDRLGDRPVVAAGERRADLEVPPRLDHLARGAVDDHLRDPGVAVHVLDLPAVAPDQGSRLGSRALGELGLDHAGRIGGPDRVLGGHLEPRRRPRLRLGLDQLRRQLAAERRLQRRIVGGRRGGREQGETAERRDQRRERPAEALSAPHQRATVARVRRDNGECAASDAWGCGADPRARSRA